ncbi:MAG: c-type cytochrome [Planctomycetes bacterium]|nr:c-type cytochrome [Planctomycetota bacterium]
MAEEGIKDAGATFFDVKRLNRWFLVSAAAMTVAYAWSVVQDHDREFKSYQWRFFELEREQAEAQGKAAFSAAGGATVVGDGAKTPGGMRDEIERLKGMLAADHAERPELATRLHDAEFVYATTNASMKLAKAIFEAERFVYEEKAHHLGEHDLSAPQGDEAKTAFAKYQILKGEYDGLDEADKQAEADRNIARNELGRFDALGNDVATRLEVTEREVARLEKRADSLDDERVFTQFRNSLLFNFMAPTVAPRKFVVKEILDDLNFLSVPKVDMCSSCHLATDRFKDYPAGNAHVTFGEEGNEPRFEDDSPAFRSHSKPELYCTSMSPHGQDRFGCSGCHGGGNQRLAFATSFHTPTNKDEREVWEDERHWHPVHEWEYPMLGSKYLDASCYKCHTQEVHIPGAEKWNRGRDLVAKLGCFGCHKMAPFDGFRRVGPPLGHVAAKFADLDFMLKWVDNPQSFRPTTRMPAFFHRENRATEPGRDQAEITALVTFLYNLTTPQALKSYPGNGDADRGKKLFGEHGGVGCLACHSIDDFPAGESKVDKLDALRHGPELSGVGSKVKPDWLFTWLLDPKSLWPETNMPNLRLTESEAADLVAYLMTKRNVAFEQSVFEKPADDKIYEEILVEKLKERMTGARAAQEVRNMSGFEKRRKSGEFLLDHYGCFGCHEIPGYEDSKPIGTELNGWGSKHPDRLDFGMVEMDWKAEGYFNREAWLTQKLTNTRFYDRNKDKKPFEKLKMPQFAQLAEGAPDADREAVMDFVFSLVKDNTISSIRRHLTPDEESVERGRRLVREKNCIGCHLLYGEGGEIRNFQLGEEGAAYYPPLLDGQGARTQHDWLDRFLNDPVMGKGRGAPAMLRPWMKARMPTFGFTQEQRNDIVAYFAHEKVWHTSTERGLWDSIAGKFKRDFPAYDDSTMRKANHSKIELFHDLVARTYQRQGGSFIYETDFPQMSKPAPLSDADRDHAREMFVRLQCVLCHMPGGVVPKGKTAADMAPDLSYARERLAPRWVAHWLETPDTYQRGTRMPGFWKPEAGVRPTNDPNGLNDPDLEMALLRDYLFTEEFATEYREIAKRAGG